MVNMNRQETRYLAAMEAYAKGNPLLSDTEFDELKKELKEEGSPFASSKEPKCYIGEFSYSFINTELSFLNDINLSLWPIISPPLE
jgi:hypothetical protein